MAVEALWTPCPALHSLPSAFQSFPEALVGDGSPGSSLLVLLMQAWGLLPTGFKDIPLSQRPASTSPGHLFLRVYLIFGTSVFKP